MIIGLLDVIVLNEPLIGFMVWMRSGGRNAQGRHESTKRRNAGNRTGVQLEKRR